MKQFGKIFFAVAIAAVILTPAAFAQSTSTATANATATILQGINIANNTELNFGSILSPTGIETVTVTPISGVSSSAPGILVGGHAAATFTVTGAASTAYFLDLPADGVVTITDGTTPMPVDGFASNAVLNLGVGGSQFFGVGATLTVAASQPAGVYTGTFSVTARYF